MKKKKKERKKERKKKKKELSLGCCWLRSMPEDSQLLHSSLFIFLPYFHLLLLPFHSPPLVEDTIERRARVPARGTRGRERGEGRGGRDRSISTSYVAVVDRPWASKNRKKRRGVESHANETARTTVSALDERRRDVERRGAP